MKLAINGYNLRDNPAGIANVAINGLNSLPDTENLQIILLVTPFINDSILNRIIKKRNLEIRIINQRNSAIWVTYSLRKEVNKINPDFLWSPAPLLPKRLKKNIQTIVTVNDFVSRDFRETMTLKGKMITTLLENKTIKNADFLWCISEYTKSRLLQLYPEKKNERIFVGCAPDQYIKKININISEKDNFLLKYGIKKNFLLFVGSLEPRKNLKFLLKVFEVYHNNNDMQLVVVGARKWGNTELAAIINSESYPKDDVIFMPFISEEELRCLYNIASCYVSTSINEGFGLPQTEAMKCECPVVTAHNSAMIEVVENAGITVKNWEIDEWVNSIDKAISNRDEIIKAQNKRMEKYNWNFISRELINFIGVKI